MYGARAQTIRDRVATIEEACTASATFTVLPLSAEIKIKSPRLTKRGVESMVSAAIGGRSLLFHLQHIEDIERPLATRLSTITLVPIVGQAGGGARSATKKRLLYAGGGTSHLTFPTFIR